MPLTAARPPTPWRRPIPGSAAHEHLGEYRPHAASPGRARGGPFTVGARGAGQRYPALCAAESCERDPDARQRLAGAVAVPWRHFADHAGRFHRRRGRRNRGGYRRRRLRACVPHCRIRLSPQHSPNVRGAAVAVRRRDCHLWVAGASFASGTTALARERAWKGKLMAAANISSEKIDLLVYGPIRPILANGFSDQFVLHTADSRADLERLTHDVVARTRGMAVTHHKVPAHGKALSHFPKLKIVASLGVGYG